MNYTTKQYVDDPGRVLLPQSMRDYFDINMGERVEIIATAEGILIKKQIR